MAESETSTAKGVDGRNAADIVAGKAMPTNQAQDVSEYFKSREKKQQLFQSFLRSENGQRQQC